MKLVLKTILLLFPVLLASSFLKTETDTKFNAKKMASPVELIDDDWAYSILDTLTLEEKISQLFMIPVYANQNANYEKKLLKQVERNQVGGIILMRGSPYASALLINEIQAKSSIPVMVAIDGEWGPAMRIDSILAFPKAMALGAIENDQLVYELGTQIAEQCKRLGIHINFAPVIDINTTYNNPIINIRAFGSAANNVARKGLAYAVGMQSNGVLAVGKHFPGHGSTHSDSHKTLPLVNQSKEQLENISMIPFQKLIQNELGGVMVAHIAYPAFDARINRPASLSPIIIDSILKKKLEFKGLIFTDALNMKGVANYFTPGHLEVEALKAGNDVLLYPENMELALDYIVKAVRDSILTENDINKRCIKVLKAKQWFGLDNYKPVALNKLKNDLNSAEMRQINHELIKASITLVKNTDGMLPLKGLENKKILALNIGAGNGSAFLNGLNRYVRVDTISIKKPISQYEKDKLLRVIKNYTHIIIGQQGVSEWPFNNFNLKMWSVKLAEEIALLKPTTLVFMGNAYALRNYTQPNVFKSILISYQNSTLLQDIASQAIFGGISVNGKLPIIIDHNFGIGSGYNFDAIRLEYADSYIYGLGDSIFYRVDSLVNAAIKIKATPGCQVLYAKNGKVIYNKCFGYNTYKNKSKVNHSTIYDIASVTKVAATTISLMKLYENNKIDLVAKFAHYFPEFKNTDKKSVRIKQVLAHQSGMRSWIPFYQSTLDENDKLRKDLYSKDSTGEFSVKVANQLFLRSDYIDSVYQAILDTPIFKKKRYRYSDLGFYWLARLINQQSHLHINDYAGQEFYDPLGMSNTLYNPYKFADYYDIAPSEDDKTFRKQVIRGYVHDQGAALIGGISGHAGLFSNANDLVKLGQLFLNRGTYGGKQYFTPKTLDVFNTVYYKRKDNRRALGFDKPPLKKGDPGPTCISASPISFGHSGFTGSYIWIDPDDQSIFVFISNRTFPNQENKKLVKYDFRTNMHQEFYNVFEKN